MRRPISPTAPLALLAGAAACVAAGGCGTVVEDHQPLQVAVHYAPARDVEENIPAIRILNDPRVAGFIRKSAAARRIDGALYQGERIEETRVKEFGAPGELLFEIVARRRAAPEPHLDIYVTSAVPWELILASFLGGTVRDGVTGGPLRPPYVLDSGTYHVQAYR